MCQLSYFIHGTDRPALATAAHAHHPMETLGTLSKAGAGRLRINEVPIEPVFDFQATRPADDNCLD